MIDINTIRCGRFSGKDIIDFEFSEGRLAGLETGWVKVSRLLSQAEVNEFRIQAPANRALLNIYSASVFVGAEFDYKHSTTMLRFEEISNIVSSVHSTVTQTYSGTTLKTVSSNILKTASDITVTMPSETTSAFSGTISLYGSSLDMIEFALALNHFGYLRHNDGASSVITYTMHVPTKKWFSLSNEINQAIVDNHLDTATQTEINGYTPDIVLSDTVFDVMSITELRYENSKTILTHKGYYSNKVLTTTISNASNYDMNVLLPYVGSESSNAIMTDWKPWLISNYIGVLGKVTKGSFDLNVGDAVQYKEYRGLVNKIVRTPDADIVYFGFPPFYKNQDYNRGFNKESWFNYSNNPKFDVWDDQLVSLDSAKVGGVKPPIWGKMMDNGAGSSGLYGWSFSDTAENEIWFSSQLPHKMSSDSDLRFHIHWMQTATSTGNIVIQFEYMWVGTFETVSNSTMITTTITGGSPPYKHNKSHILTITNTGQGISSAIFCRLGRLGNTPADTNNQSMYLMFADVHYKIDSMGSRGEYSK